MCCFSLPSGPEDESTVPVVLYGIESAVSHDIPTCLRPFSQTRVPWPMTFPSSGARRDPKKPLLIPSLTLHQVSKDEQDEGMHGCKPQGWEHLTGPVPCARFSFQSSSEVDGYWDGY